MTRPLPRNDYQDLERLYRDTAGASGAPGNLQRPSRSPWRRLTMIVFFLLALGSLAAWSGFYVFNSLNKNRPSELRLEITAPETAAVGETIEYRVGLNNVAVESVTDVNLRLNYPDGFVWQSATLSPESAGHNSWSLGALRAGEQKEIMIKGIILGESGGIKTIFGVASYRLPNFRSELEVTASSGIKLNDSNLILSWVGPGVSAPGKEAQYELKYEYNGASELPASVLHITFSPNFKVMSAAPAPDLAGEYKWSIAALLPKSAGSIVISGAWAAEAAGEEIISAQLEARSDTGAWLKIASSSVSTRVSEGAVTLSIQVNGNSAPAAVNLGDTLSYALEYENTSDRSIEEAAIQVRYDTNVIDWSGVVMEESGRIDNNTIVWESAKVPALVKVLPKGKGVLRWTVPLMKILPANMPASDITSVPIFSYKKLDGEIAENSFEGAAVTVPVNSAVSLEVWARYFDDTNRAVGKGPLPPKAGETTAYLVSWRIRGAVHGLKEIEIKAELPAGVSASAEGVTAETGTWQITDDGSPRWTISELAPGLEPSISFFIELKPSASDVGRVLALITRTALNAVDDVTKGNVSALGNVITTNLEFDPVARGQGVVAK